ncbi:hypothetical protein LEMLEM_LOCUS3408 [Lemmus lemmus]
MQNTLRLSVLSKKLKNMKRCPESLMYKSQLLVSNSFCVDADGRTTCH